MGPVRDLASLVSGPLVRNLFRCGLCPVVGELSSRLLGPVVKDLLFGGMDITSGAGPLRREFLFETGCFTNCFIAESSTSEFCAPKEFSTLRGVRFLLVWSLEFLVPVALSLEYLLFFSAVQVQALSLFSSQKFHHQRLQ